MDVLAKVRVERTAGPKRVSGTAAYLPETETIRTPRSPKVPSPRRLWSNDTQKVCICYVRRGRVRVTGARSFGPTVGAVRSREPFASGPDGPQYS